jgi:hypothetical protein
MTPRSELASSKTPNGRTVNPIKDRLGGEVAKELILREIFALNSWSDASGQA